MLDAVVSAVVDVAEDAAARLDFRYSWLHHAQRVGARAAAAHDGDGQPGLAAPIGARGELRHRDAYGFRLLRGVLDRRGVAFPAHDPAEAQAGMPRDELRERDAGRAGFDAGAVEPDVHLDHDAQP